MSGKRAGGFTLLEVLVALTIASLALVVLFRTGGDGLFAVSTAGRAEEALQRAQSHLAAVGRDVALLQGESEGEDGSGYHWRLRIAPVAAWTAPLPNGKPGAETLFDVEVSISWPARGQPRRVTLRTRRIAAVAAGS